MRKTHESRFYDDYRFGSRRGTVGSGDGFSAVRAWRQSRRAQGPAERVEGAIAQRNNGTLVSMVQGKALAYALFNLQERGKLFVGHGEPVYEGMIVGIHKRQNDLVVNPTKAKQLTNIRAAGTDENLILTPKLNYSLEQSLEFLDDDELLEVTPTTLRLRKKLLKETDRKRESRKAS